MIINHHILDQKQKKIKLINLRKKEIGWFFLKKDKENIDRYKK